VINKLENMSSTGQMMRYLARVPSIVECARSALRDTQEAKLTELRDQTRDFYNASVNILRDLEGSYLATAPKISNPHGKKNQFMFFPRDWILYAHFQRSRLVSSIVSFAP
jgi:hypothetical protein